MTRNKTSHEPRGESGGPTGARSHRFALVVSRYHEEITDRLRQGALDGRRRHVVIAAVHRGAVACR